MGVIENICQRWDVLYFSCRGYSSQSEMCKAAQRLVARISAGQKVRIIHLGDHARVVKDMSLDIDERLMAFVSFHLASRNGPTPLSDRLRLERIALNMDQVRRYKSATESRQDNRFARRRVHSGARARILGTGCSRSRRAD